MHLFSPSGPFLVLAVFVCTLIQSVFGVGLLVFGTPLLLLAGYPFEQVLMYLLPCSMAVNLLQVFGSWSEIRLKRDFAYLCLPFVMIGLAFVLWMGHTINIKIWVGALMVLTAFLRSSKTSREKLQNWIRSQQGPALMLIGSVHGLTNMGGGLLSIFVSSVETSKNRIRATIALGYLLMAVTQIAVLLTRGHVSPSMNGLALVALSGTTYSLVGNRLFRLSSERHYQHVLTAFITIFGLSLFL
jgi:uncharacterized membrane protein YfcA